MKDLVILCADKNTEFLLKGLFPRLPVSSGLRSFDHKTFVHPHKDSGVLNEAHQFLRPYKTQYAKTLVLWDVEGCGRDERGRGALELQVEESLCKNGWTEENVCAIAIQPELENWLWGLSEAHLKTAFGWKEETSLNSWVREKGFWADGLPKPSRPKEAVEAALVQSGKSRSSAIYKQIATAASYKHCTDEAFLKMLQRLKEWFPKEAHEG